MSSDKKDQYVIFVKTIIMDTSLTSQTLAQIVNNNHKSATVFEKYHLDFCCKGKRSLQKACEEPAVIGHELDGCIGQ